MSVGQCQGTIHWMETLKDERWNWLGINAAAGQQLEVKLRIESDRVVKYVIVFPVPRDGFLLLAPYIRSVYCKG